MSDKEEIEVEAEVHFHDASYEVPHDEEDEETDESERQNLMKRRKVLRGKITRAINRLTDQMVKKTLVKPLAEKDMQDIRKDFNEAISVNSELYEHETKPSDHSKLDNWEVDLVRDIHLIEIKTEDYISEMTVKVTRKTESLKEKENLTKPAKYSSIEQYQESEIKDPPAFTEFTESIDAWIDHLIEFKETVLPTPTGDMSIADALYRLEVSRDISSMKLTTFNTQGNECQIYSVKQ